MMVKIKNQRPRSSSCEVIKKEKVKDHAAFELEVELQKTFDHPNICRAREGRVLVGMCTCIVDVPKFF